MNASKMDSSIFGQRATGKRMAVANPVFNKTRNAFCSTNENDETGFIQALSQNMWRKKLQFKE